MEINKKLPAKRCWEMVNRVSSLEEAAIAEAWLAANEVITNAEYNDLMMALSYLTRELHHKKSR